jgi:predicted transcriptional regulator
VSGEPDVADLAAVLEDGCARCILVQARTEPMSASELADGCDVSEPTVYRRLETLREYDLVVERTQPEEGGHHYHVYRTRLDRVTIQLTDDGFEVDVRRASLADRFTRLGAEM